MLLKSLRQVNAKKEALFFQIQQNGYNCEMRKRWKAREERIRHIVANYDSSSKFTFMKNLGYNFA